MAKASRGRPRGSSPHKEIDEPVLRQAAWRLITGSARNPTEAFRDVIGEVEDHVIRRLQRAWRRDGERLLAELQSPLWDGRWEHEAAALEKAAPQVAARIKAFAQSEGGAQILAERLGDRPPSHLMSLGIIKLWELVEDHVPIGAAAADRAFAQLLYGWSRFGAGPDAVFLRRLAERCLERARALETAEGPDAATPPGEGEAS